MAEGKGHTELQPAYCFPIRASRKHLFVSDAQMRVIAEMADRPDREFWAKHIVAAVNTYPAVEGLVKVLEGLIEGATTEFNEKGAGGYALARLTDARAAISRFRSLQNGGANG